MKTKKEVKKGISVIIPTFNRTKFLYSTLICLSNQKVKEKLEYEIIIIDSGDDETESIVHNFQNSGRVSIIYEKIKKCKNRSLLRNTGVEFANYSILCFLDNDMLTPPNFIQTHFDEHEKNEHTVLLGCRKSLLHFDISQIGEEALQTNFNILEYLPYYTDERLRMFNDIEPWRFVFSHTLSIERDDYKNSGGFNVDFGEHWGFEDLELGFSLQLIGCKIKLLTNLFSFHQPHFEQSNKEQHEMSHNAELFIQLHNCFECELYESFYTSFDEFYPILSKLKKEFVLPSKETQKKYDLIFGCLFSSMENVQYKNMYLGAYSMKKDNSCNNLLVVNTFFDLPEIIQMSIITEAFRISKCVCIENKEITKIKGFMKIAENAGLIIEYKSETDKILFFKKDNTNAKIFIMLLPDIYEPEKRYVYSWLAAHLLKNGTYVNIRDMKKTEKMCFDDFYLPEDSQRLIENNFERCFGKTALQFINSLSMLLVDSSPAIPNSNRTFIIHDEDYVLKFKSLKFRMFGNATHFNESVFDCLSFLSVYEESELYKRENHPIVADNTFCCFMENGYKEDGIDLILEAFSEYKKTNPKSKLSIKLPDYKSFENVVFTLHNEVSKQSKLFAGNQKRKLELIKLKARIEELKLNNDVVIVQKNFSMKEVVEFIGTHQTLLFASRGCAVSPQVYISLILEKRTVIGRHHMILSNLLPYCSITEGKPYEFAPELEVPFSCLNLPFVAFRILTQDITEKMNCNFNKITDEVKIDLAKEAYKIIDTYFVKKLSFVEG